MLKIFLITHCKQFSTIRAAIHASVRSVNLSYVTSRWKNSGCVNYCVNECTLCA